MEQLDPKIVLGGYAVGVFPMADSRDADSVYWVEPRRRAILPLDGFHLARSLRKTIVRDRFRVTVDAAFPQILALCAESVDCWDGEALVGGLYGLALGRAFFGESMVSRATDASKVALAHLVARMKAGGFDLLDCQFQTAHLASLGAVEIDRNAYVALLRGAIEGVAGEDSAGTGSAAGDFFALDRFAADSATGAVSGPVAGNVIAQLLAQTS